MATVRDDEITMLPPTLKAGIAIPQSRASTPMTMAFVQRSCLGHCAARPGRKPCREGTWGPQRGGSSAAPAITLIQFGHTRPPGMDTTLFPRGAGHIIFHPPSIVLGTVWFQNLPPFGSFLSKDGSRKAVGQNFAHARRVAVFLFCGEAAAFCSRENFVGPSREAADPAAPTPMLLKGRWGWNHPDHEAGSRSEGEAPGTVVYHALADTRTTGKRNSRTKFPKPRRMGIFFSSRELAFICKAH